MIRDPASCSVASSAPHNLLIVKIFWHMYRALAATGVILHEFLKYFMAKGLWGVYFKVLRCRCLGKVKKLNEGLSLSFMILFLLWHRKVTGDSQESFTQATGVWQAQVVICYNTPSHGGWIAANFVWFFGDEQHKMGL